MKPRLLDLFCGAGGASEGYALAGFDVVGVDINPQPHYPYEFHRADALAWLDRRMEQAWICERPFDDFTAVHASPPCQSFTAYKRRGDGVGDGYENLIPQVRELLRASGLPYVIENVEGAPLENPTMLCGSAFGLDVQRHRLFETNWPLMSPGCVHGRNAARFPQATNRKNKRRTVEVGVWRIPLIQQRRAMGIGWMTLEELSEAIPPAYTRYIGTQLRSILSGSHPIQSMPEAQGAGRSPKPASVGSSPTSGACSISSNPASRRPSPNDLKGQA